MARPARGQAATLLLCCRHRAEKFPRGVATGGQLAVLLNRQEAAGGYGSVRASAFFAVEPRACAPWPAPCYAVRSGSSRYRSKQMHAMRSTPRLTVLVTAATLAALS